MEVSAEPFGIQKLPLQRPQMMENMRLIFAPDGTAVYKPIPTVGSNGSESIGGGNANSGIEPIKKKRGRPRKYGPDGIAVSPSSVGPGPSVGSGGSSSAPAAVKSTGGSADGMKKRGRPAGSGKKLKMDALVSAGTGFIPHIINVKAGEDISSKIMLFSQSGPRSVCILSANGAISNVTLRRSAVNGGTVTYEGRFAILSLSGLFDSDGQHNGLSVSLAGPDSKVLGGIVAGVLTAASFVQVVVGSFIAEGKKEPKKKTFTNSSSAPQNLVVNEPIPVTRSDSPSGGTLSDSSVDPDRETNTGGPMNVSMEVN